LIKVVHFKKIINYTKNPVFKNIVIVGLVTLVVKGFGFFKETIVASNLGLSELLDTFYIAILIPSFIHNVFIGAFKNVFIPNYISEDKTTHHIGSFQSTSFLVAIGIAIIFILIAILFTDIFLEIFFKGHTVQYYNLIKIQFYVVVPCIIFWAFSSIISGLLNISGEFTYASFYPVFSSIAIIIGLVWFSDILKERVLAVGILIGSIAEFIFLLSIAVKRKIIHLKKPDFYSKNVIIMFKQMPAKVSAGFLIGMVPFVDQFFAAQLIIGSIAALNYSIKIPSFLSAIIIMSLGSVLLPYFSNLAVDDKEKAFQKLKFVLLRLFIMTFAIAFILIVASKFIIKLIFERNAFTPDDTFIVSNLQMIFLIYIPFYVCGIVLVKFLISFNKNVFMAYVSLGTVILNIILNTIFIKKIGVYGIALSTTIVYVLNSIVLLRYTILLHNKLKTSNIKIK